MISSQFPLQSFMLWIFEREGEFTDDEKDSGNWTGGKVGVGQLNGSKYGISAASYPALDIKSLTRDGATRCYENDYWKKAGCDKLPPKIAFAHADAAVQHGQVQAIKLLQRAVGAVEDGQLGPATLNSVKSKDPDYVLEQLLAERLAHYMRLPPDKTGPFAKGWSVRLVKLCKEIYS
jgi:lysozyme family protein